jgi:hypothetical protein
MTASVTWAGAAVAWDGAPAAWTVGPAVSRIERVLTALTAALAAGLSDGVRVTRNAVLPERIPPGGFVTLRDGSPGEPEVLLSPLLHLYAHRAEVEILIEAPPELRDARFDALKLSLGAAVAADRTLGGLCDWVECVAPEPVDLPVEGAAGFKAAVIPIVLHYATPDPLF